MTGPPAGRRRFLDRDHAPIPLIMRALPPTHLTLEIREVMESRNLIEAGGSSTKQTPDHLTGRIPLLGNKHNAGMRPALAQPIPVKLSEVARVRSEKQAAMACRKA